MAWFRRYLARGISARLRVILMAILAAGALKLTTQIAFPVESASAGHDGSARLSLNAGSRNGSQ
jgi:hypothetical protein